MTATHSVETTARVTLVLARDGIGILVPDTDDTGSYRMRDTVTGAERTVPADPQSSVLHTTTVGVLHSGCGCTPKDAAAFGSATVALVYARNALTSWRYCPLTPGRE